MLVILAGVLVAAAGAAAGWFTVYVLDQRAVQDSVRRILADHYDLDVRTVNCPANQEVKAGNVFTCSVQFGADETGSVRIVIVNKDGEYTVGRP